MGKVLAKYDIRGIQSFVFRTNKFNEIRHASDWPEKIIKETVDKVQKKFGLKDKEDYEIIDIAGGNALFLFINEDLFKRFSAKMAYYILKKTYSLKLVYACVECTEDFYKDYTQLNKKLGKLKSSMPEACHTGAFPICRQDYLTGFPIASINYEGNAENRKKIFYTEESKIKHVKKENEEDKSKQLDDYILGKGEDSHIAVIHIDGNNMGNTINKIINKAKYSNVNEVFSQISVRESFKDVCCYMEKVVEKYREMKKESKQLILSVIRAGDDITYITRANIALSFTKLFLKKISEKTIGSNDEEYKIHACAGIAFIKSHFPFSDAYELAEKCCVSAKNKLNDFSDGDWIDFEICRHIKNIDLSGNRKKYGMTTDTEGKKAFLHMRPYCIATENNKNDFFDYDEFENRIMYLNGKKEMPNEGNKIIKSYNRSRSKALQQAYVDGGSAVDNFISSSESRNYRSYNNENLFKQFTNKKDGSCSSYCVYYDAIEIMDLFDTVFCDYINKCVGGVFDEKI